MTVTMADSAGTAINLTAWTGRFRVSETYDGADIISVAPVSMSSAGVVLIALTAAETLALQPYDDDCVVFQIDLDKDDNTEAHRLQGKVKVYPEIGS